MKYIELIVTIFCICLIGWNFSRGIEIYTRLNRTNSNYLERINANNFISESFMKACEGVGFENLYEWQKTCKDMWNLKYIGWSDVQDVIPFDSEYKGKGFYGTWVGKSYKGEVYWKE